MKVAVQKALSAARVFKRSKQPTKFQKIKFQEKKNIHHEKILYDKFKWKNVDKTKFRHNWTDFHYVI